MFVLLDADRFKSVNDNYGHDVGDKVIVAIADCMKESFRSGDVLMRLGGDEFAVFSPGVTDESTAQLMMGRFFDRIGKVDIPELRDFSLTLSAGISFSNDDGRPSFSNLYRRADMAAYVSKKYEGCHVSFFSTDVSEDIRR